MGVARLGFLGVAVLTILVRSCEHNALERRDGGEDQDGSQARVAQPFSFAKCHTCGNEDIV